MYDNDYYDDDDDGDRSDRSNKIKEREKTVEILHVMIIITAWLKCMYGCLSNIYYFTSQFFIISSLSPVLPFGAFIYNTIKSVSSWKLNNMLKDSSFVATQSLEQLTFSIPISKDKKTCRVE